MASGPITPWQIDGETTAIVRNFTFLGSKITEDDNYNHEIKRHLILGRKAMTNLDSTLKAEISLYTANKGPYSQSYGFFNSHVWMGELTIKKAEH